MRGDGRINTDIRSEEAAVDTEPSLNGGELRGDIPESGRSRRWIWVLGLTALVVAAAAVIAAAGASSDNGTTDTAAVLSFAEVVRTDLVEQQSYDGVLGTEAGDPINSPRPGTVTSTAEVGNLIGEGDVFLTVDNEPVVLLYGGLPAYRELRATEESLGLAGHAAGVVTDVAAAGETLSQGDVLYRVNGEPVVVMYGDVPAYRTMRDLSENMEGDDVLQLERALAALGYDPDGVVTVDAEFTDSTESMVERWQEDIGVEADGIVELGDVVFIPEEADILSVAIEVGQAVGSGQLIATITSGNPLTGDDVRQLEESLAALGYDVPAVDGVWDAGTKSALVAWQEAAGFEADGVVGLGEIVFLPATVRVNEVLASSGSTVGTGTPVLGVSSADQFVTFDLPASDQGLLAVGQEVNIEMPDGSDTPGSVVSIASVATAGQQGEAAFEVKIVLDDPSVAVGLDEAPVDVEVVSDSVGNVIAVPVSALVALAEGGYAVEVETATGATQLVGVEPGFYAEGLVEITSSALNVGDRVVVP